MTWWCLLKATRGRIYRGKRMWRCGGWDRWCRHHKLEVSIAKSVMMLLKGKPNLNRPPCFKMGQYPIRRVWEYMYLDVILNEKLRFTQHANRSAAKCTTWTAAGNEGRIGVLPWKQVDNCAKEWQRQFWPMQRVDGGTSWRATTSGRCCCATVEASSTSAEAYRTAPTVELPLVPMCYSSTSR